MKLKVRVLRDAIASNLTLINDEFSEQMVVMKRKLKRWKKLESKYRKELMEDQRVVKYRKYDKVSF